MDLKCDILGYTAEIVQI